MKNKEIANDNPFNISFGRVPIKPIERFNEFNEIYTSFNSINPQSNLYILTGPRGCGKTISLNMIKEYYKNINDWLIVNINPNIDILEQLASRIYESGLVKKLFMKSEFNFSFSGLSLSLHGETPVSSVSVLLEKIFDYLKKKNVKVLILIDEVSNNEYMKAFAPTFQILLREDYLLYSVMTGLFENISDLQNEKTLTFLYRAPKINLLPLNLHAITLSYSEIFNIGKEQALTLAKLTKGYAFAYQLLGNILFTENKTNADNFILNKYDLLLDERVYSKIYSELTTREKEILKTATKTHLATNSNIETNIKISKNGLAVYKKRLYNKGLISLEERGKIKFTLPRFKEFIEFKIAEEMEE